MIGLYNAILYDPIFNLLLWLHHVIPGGDFGVAIIVVTLIAKLILFAPGYAGIRQQKVMQDLQPKIEAVRKKVKDKQQQSQELMKLYRENKVNPFSSCLPLLVQFPILIAMYQVFLGGIGKLDEATKVLLPEQLEHLYTSGMFGNLRDVYASLPLEPTFLGFIDLTVPNVFFAILAAGVQYWQARMLMARRQPSGAMGSMSRNMMYFGPGLALVFGLVLPSGLSLYWIVSTLFQVAQQFVFLRRNTANDGTPASP